MDDRIPEYQLSWLKPALKEFQSLPKPLQQQIAKKLIELRSMPKIPKNALRGKLAGCYKIKLQSAGVRLIYKVDDGKLIILVLAVGKREDSAIYKIAEGRG